MRPIRTFLAALLIAAGPLAPMGLAQSAYAPVVMVNDSAITGYDIDQRARFSAALGASGDLRGDARETLIEEALMKHAIARAGVTPAPERVEQEIADLAGRMSQTPESLRARLSDAGVDALTLADFARTSVAWRQVVRDRFLSQVAISEDEIDRALEQSESGLRALISEIVLPLLPGQEDAIRALAEDLRQSLTTQSAFERAARRYSSAVSRDRGGRIDWLNLSDLSPVIATRLIGMAPGEVSTPTDNGQVVFLFFLRDIAETRPRARDIAALDYMWLRLPDAGSAATRTRLARIRAATDRCGDLWPQARGLAEGALTRQTFAPADIAPRIRAELALLDAGEISTRLTSPDGSEAWVLMLCGRSPALTENESREDVTRQLRNQRLTQLANSYLAELRATASIETP